MDDRSVVDQVLGPALELMLLDLGLIIRVRGRSVLVTGKRDSVLIDRTAGEQASYWRVDGKPFYTRSSIIFYCYGLLN